MSTPDEARNAWNQGAKLYPVGAIRAAIKFARETWRGENGAEGDTVHLLCNELEHRLGVVDIAEPRKRCEHDNYQSITGLCLAYDRWCNVCGAIRITPEHKWLLPEVTERAVAELIARLLLDRDLAEYGSAEAFVSHAVTKVATELREGKF